MTTTAISLSLIDPPAWNSRMPKAGAAARLEEEKITELAESLKAEGQLTPVEVESKPDGRFELVFGSRRVRAATVLKWDSIIATVKAPTTAAEKISRNIVENEQRENLTTFEQARAYVQLRELGFKNKDIGDKLGKSQQTVSNLISHYTSLPPQILTEWQKDHPVATFGNLAHLANSKEFPTPEKQVQAWDVMVALAAERAKATGAKPGKRGKGKAATTNGHATATRAIPGNLNLLLDMRGKAAAARMPSFFNAESTKWFQDAIAWLVGQRKTPPEGVVVVSADK